MMLNFASQHHQQHGGPPLLPVFPELSLLSSLNPQKGRGATFQKTPAHDPFLGVLKNPEPNAFKNAVLCWEGQEDLVSGLITGITRVTVRILLTKSP